MCSTMTPGLGNTWFGRRLLFCKDSPEMASSEYTPCEFLSLLRRCCLVFKIASIEFMYTMQGLQSIPWWNMPRLTLSAGDQAKKEVKWAGFSKKLQKCRSTSVQYQYQGLEMTDQDHIERCTECGQSPTVHSVDHECCDDRVWPLDKHLV